VPPCDELVAIASTASWFFRLYYNNSEVLSMSGGTAGRHVARHGADPARPGGAPVDPTLGHDRSRCSDTPRRRSGKSQPRRERAGGSRKAADMHCTMMSDHDLPVVVNPFN
jgi:uncharacterized protein YegP (UPF0339 family)